MFRFTAVDVMPCFLKTVYPLVVIFLDPGLRSNVLTVIVFLEIINVRLKARVHNFCQPLKEL